MLKRTLFTFLLASMLLCLLLPAVCAADAGEISFEDLELVAITEEDKARVWELANLEEIPLPEQMEKRFGSFGVSPQGDVVLAFDWKELLLFNSEGQPVRAFRFDTSGSAYVFWHQESIALYLVRSDYILLFTPEGEFVDALKLRTDSVKNNSFMNDLLHRTELSLDGNHYLAQKRGGILGFFEGYEYSRFVRQGATGEETVFYAIENPPLPVFFFVFIGLFMIVFTILLCGLIIPLIVKKIVFKRNRI